ncbi:MAG: LptF/LptG family permease [Alphaproteobacteria bacterium]|nr:LptF/LptG family permease [Alphaproteobacteria bacterium]
MRTVERYITGQVVRTSSAALVIILTGLILDRTLWMISEVDPGQLPLGIAAALLACKVPEGLVIAIPPSFFAGILLTFQRLVREGELDAIFASGVGLGRLLRPLLMLSASVAAIAVVLIWYLAPLARYEYAALVHKATQRAITAPFKAGTFVRFGDNVLYIQPQADPDGGLGPLFLYQHDDRGTEITTARAERFAVSDDRTRLFFSLDGGQRLTLPDDGGKPIRVSFLHANEQLYAVDASAFRPRGEDPRELTVPELLSALHGTPPRTDAAPWLAQLHTKLARAAVVLLLPLIALPLALVFPVSWQWAGIATGAALIIGIDQALIFAETVVGLSRSSPWAAVWGAVGGFIGVGLVLAALQGSVTARARW